MKRYALNAPLKTLTAAVLLSLLSACGGDNDDNGGDPVAPGNTPPVANPVDASATMGSPSMIDALANDTDVDGDDLTLETVTLFDGRGVATIDGNRIRFEPLEVGTTILNYSISDGNGGHASSTVTISVSAQALSYVGTEACLSCHTDKKTYLESGHNFKLTKVVDGQEPTYPFTSLSGAVELMDVNNTLGNPNGWEDISYVIGAYKGWTNFIDKNGYIMTGNKATTVAAPKGEQVHSMYAFHPEGAPDSDSYDYCGRCHTTGWKDYTEGSHDNRNLNRQDDMPGMGGTFAMTGIQCEACHGAGLAHIQSPSKHNITKIAEPRTTDDYQAQDMGFGQAIACIECHTTDDAVRRYPDYQSPFEQTFGVLSLNARLGSTGKFGSEGRRGGRGGRHAAATMIGVDPDTGEAMGKKQHFTCSTCHNPHRSEHYQDQPGHEDAMVRECSDCHTKTFANAPGSDIAAAAHEFTAQCTDCHMPSASHLFKIDLDGAKDDPRHFSADGEYIKPWLRAWDSCSGCHEDDYDERAARIGKIHN